MVVRTMRARCAADDGYASCYIISSLISLRRRPLTPNTPSIHCSSTAPRIYFYYRSTFFKYRCKRGDTYQNLDTAHADDQL